MRHDEFPTSAAVPHHTDRLTDLRDLAGLHRDVWAIVRQNPLVFVVLPALLWLPFDFLSEWVSLATSDDVFTQIRTAQRVGRIGEMLAGTLIPAIVLFTLREGMNGKKVGMGEALKGGASLWGKVFSALFTAGLYALGGFLLLILPGFVVTARVSLAPVVVLFEGKTGSEAVKRSMEIVKERGTTRILLWGFAGYCVYLVLAMSLAMGVGFAESALGLPETALVNALSSIPANLIMVGILIGTAVIYVDSVEVKASYPLGRELSTDDGTRITPPAGTGTPGLVLASVAAAIALPLVGGAVFMLFEEGAMDEDGYVADEGTELSPEEIEAIMKQLEAPVDGADEGASE